LAKTRQQKKEMLSSYEEYLKSAKAIYLASTKLTANESNSLKKDLSSGQATFNVVKNTLFGLATKNVLGEDITLAGPVAAIVCTDDVVAPAKKLSELKKEDKASYVLCILDGKVIDVSKIDSLANLESREVLLGKLAFLVNYPATGLARSLANNIEKLLYALNAVKDSK
jgi:large subunit ribosomal protein L10